MSPFGDRFEHDLSMTERAMEKAFLPMSKHMHDTIAEMEQSEKKAIEVMNNADKLTIKCDVHTYKPEEILVKTSHHMLIIHGKHEENTDGKHTVHEFTRKFILPKEVDPNTVVSSLTKEGCLTVEAPKKAPIATERMIPIDRK